MQKRATWPHAASGEKPGQSVAEGAARGFAFALMAYLMWGLLPLYMKAVAHIPALEVLAHRVLWSIPIAAAVLFATGRTADFRAALHSPRTLALAALSALLITINWGTYVWAIAVGRAVETALGYYINPLMTVALAALLLGERLNRFQVAAIALAVVAVGVLTIEAGGLPWVSLVLASSFAAYGYLRKTLPIGPSQGFLLEVLIVALPALGWVVWLEATGSGHFRESWADTGLLLLAGPVTAIPLLFFGFGAKLLKFSTIGIMQYIAPTLVAAIAVFVFGEPFGWARVVAFALIWVALLLYTWTMFKPGRAGG